MYYIKKFHDLGRNTSRDFRASGFGSCEFVITAF